MGTVYRVLAGRELDAGLVTAWEDIRRGEGAFASPFLSADFTRTVAEVRADVFVTVIENEGRPVGFFPHQRRGNRGMPVAAPLNDCQAVVVEPTAKWSPVDLLEGSKLRLWDFDHLRAEQTLFRPYARHMAQSPVIHLGAGFEAYMQDRKAAGSRRLSQFARKRIAQPTGYRDRPILPRWAFPSSIL